MHKISIKRVLVGII